MNPREVWTTEYVEEFVTAGEEVLLLETLAGDDLHGLPSPRKESATASTRLWCLLLALWSA